jgi:hypothetical protein
VGSLVLDTASSDPSAVHEEPPAPSGAARHHPPFLWLLRHEFLALVRPEVDPFPIERAAPKLVARREYYSFTNRKTSWERVLSGLVRVLVGGYWGGRQRAMGGRSSRYAANSCIGMKPPRSTAERALRQAQADPCPYKRKSLFQQLESDETFLAVPGLSEGARREASCVPARDPRAPDRLFKRNRLAQR